MGVSSTLSRDKALLRPVFPWWVGIGGGIDLPTFNVDLRFWIASGMRRSQWICNNGIWEEATLAVLRLTAFRQENLGQNIPQKGHYWKTTKAPELLRIFTNGQMQRLFDIYPSHKDFFDESKFSRFIKMQMYPWNDGTRPLPCDSDVR